MYKRAAELLCMAYPQLKDSSEGGYVRFYCSSQPLLGSQSWLVVQFQKNIAARNIKAQRPKGVSYLVRQNGDGNFDFQDTAAI